MPKGLSGTKSPEEKPKKIFKKDFTNEAACARITKL
jgi:hypothetical protein